MGDDDPKHSLQTRLVRTGSDPEAFDGAMNPPPQRASTVLLPTAEDLYAPGKKTYGLVGMAAQDALRTALGEIEDADHVLLTASGLVACALPIFALGAAGGHVLVTDSVYGPTRRYCDRSLKRWGGEAEYFNPDIGADIETLIRPETKLIILESPGSLTFEVHDTPAITNVARKHGVVTALDNTWGAGVNHKPLDLGVDISIHATTKYPAGHADVLSGAILTRDPAIAARLAEASADLGLTLSAEDAYLTLRGLRSMTTRLRQHEASAYAVADWLAERPDVKRVLHPGRPDDPYHPLWKRDFTGSAGLFGVVLEPCSEAAVLAFLNALTLFGLGFSWGGYESLAIHCDPQLKRTAAKPKLGGPLLRFSIGLESPEDLIADLDEAFAALALAAR